jgi:hypothetical protein
MNLGPMAQHHRTFVLIRRAPTRSSTRFSYHAIHQTISLVDRDRLDYVHACA